MKKLFLFITMLFLSITSYAYDIAVENADGKTIYYNYINDGQELEVTDGNAPYSGIVNIPETVTFMNRTRKVTSIRSFTFYYSRDITSITIPSSVTFIGKSSFEKCSKLTSVHISDVAAWCKIVFEEPYTSNPLVQAHHLFLNGEEIKELVIPSGVISINAGAFYGCFELKSVSIPEGVTVIGESAFCECRNIVSISFPSSVKSIGKYAFNFLDRLTSVHITDIAAWCDIDFVGYWYWSNPLYYAHHLYLNGTEVTDLVIPEGVSSIGNFAFGGCSGLTSVTIPSSVTSIGAYSFEGCDIPIVVSLIEDPFKISNEIFTQNTLKNATLYVPEGTIEKYKATEGWKDFLFIEEGNPVGINDDENTKYTLTYIVDGEEYKSYQIAEGSAITPEAAPTKDGYVFSGWSTIPATMPAEDVTITGSFSLLTDEDEITIKDIGKTTWCSKYDLDFTNVEGIKAYTATGYNNITKTIWLTRVMEVPAGTGILVKGDAGTYKIPHAEVQSAYANWFVGNLGETISISATDGDKTNYYLSGKDGSFVSVNGSANIGKNKAYLQLPTSVFGGTRSIGISYDDEDGTTSIKNLTPALSEGEGVWYTLQGQRVAKPGKGLYIRNGKVVVIK